MLNLEDSVLLVIDVQGRLAHSMFEHQKLYHNLERMIKIAKVFDLPVLWTEQAPDKIGPTIPQIHDLLYSKCKPFAKRSFSAWGCPDFVQALRSLNRKQVIITGVETHVCVYQTASDLQRHGFDVYVVADAVSSRSQTTHEITISRMRHQNIVVTCAESVICELLKTADHPKFKEMMTYIKE